MPHSVPPVQRGDCECMTYSPIADSAFGTLGGQRRLNDNMLTKTQESAGEVHRVAVIGVVSPIITVVDIIGIRIVYGITGVIVIRIKLNSNPAIPCGRHIRQSDVDR